MMLGALYLKPEPKKILVLGLGGGTLPTTIMLDAYDHEYIPEHLLTREFLTEVKKDWDKDARVLTDQYSPSNLLNAR
jgi:spermidine synthase